MPLSPSAPQRMERSNPHFANEQSGQKDSDPDSQASKIYAARSPQLEWRCSGKHESKHKRALCLLGCSRAASSSVLPSTHNGMRHPSQRPLSHTGSDACGEPAADRHVCLHRSRLRDIGWSALNTYIQLCPGCPSSSADVCLWLLWGVRRTGVSSPTLHQNLLKASAQTKAQDWPQQMIWT